MNGPEFPVDVWRTGLVAVVAPRGEIDLATVGALRAALRTEETRPWVVLDLRHVEFMDSSGIGVVVEQMRRCEQDGLEFAVVRGPKHLHKLFRMVGLAERLVVLDDLPTAPEAGTAA